VSRGAASPALTPPPGNPRFPLLDSVRGIAGFLVVLAHTYTVLHTVDAHGGFIDNLVAGIAIVVPVFYALSAFVLVRPALQSIADGREPLRVATFFRRRALRILPAYWVALTLCGLLIPKGAMDVFSDRWWVFYFFGQSFSLTDNYNGLAVAVSLSVEVVFYLTLPLLLVSIARAGRRFGWERAAWAVVGAMVVLGVAVHVLNSIEFGSRGFVVFIQKIVYAFPGQACFFGVGIGLAILSVRGRTPRIALRPGACWAAGIALYFVMVTWFGFVHPHGGLDFRTRFITNTLMSLVFVTLILLPGVFDLRPSIPRRVMSFRPFVYTGIVSYPLYLWHVPIETWLLQHVVTDVADWSFLARSVGLYIIVLVPSMIVASISYYALELPFLRLKAPRRDRVAA
jgi:peptidoglycan/LPS O-acetylase OafA/YrhL